jgi:hypothetical protein
MNEILRGQSKAKDGTFSFVKNVKLTKEKETCNANRVNTGKIISY